MIRFKYMLVSMLIVTAGLNAQSIRTESMGGLGYSIIDEDNSLTPFDFGDNPAWLINDQKQDWLKIVPATQNSWGDYKRAYDPERTSLSGIMFRGVKVLEDGVFRGQTTYEYDYRKSVSRSLKYNTYNGEAFYMNDSTTGNFRYHGPAMQFMYSFEPADNLFAGASASYRILNGLKNTYSRAETFYREVYGNAGIAYKFSDSFIAGATVSYKNNQEKIESKSDDLLHVEIFNYRGDTYYTSETGPSVSEKFIENTASAGVQLYYSPAANLEFGIDGKVSKGKNRFYMPYGDAEGEYDEYESGYSSITNYEAKLAARYIISESAILTASAGYNERKSWSETTIHNLLIWEWDVVGLKAAAGGSFKITDNILLAAEYQFASNSADSSKYIDGVYYDKSSGDHLVKIGCEAEVIKNVFLRAGYNYGTKEIDFIYGGKDIKYSLFTFGLGLNTFEIFNIDFLLSYNTIKPGDHDYTRSGFSSYAAVKLFTF